MTNFNSENLALKAIMLVCLLSACDSKQSLDSVQAESLSNEPVSRSLKYDLNLHPAHKVVCDPFETIPSIDAEKGIIASLFYETASGSAPLKNSTSSLDYVKNGVKSSQKIFLSDLNVPTRLFNNGFTTQSHSVIQDDQGVKLIEYFGLRFETDLVLSDTDEEGLYELALLSDDGTTLKIKQDQQWKTLIANDGNHPTKMGCTTELVEMKRNKAVSIDLTYYQGPRFHISNVLIWRKVNDSSDSGKDPLCQKLGNSLYFNPDKNSEPQQAYLDLLNRNWRPVKAENFNIPGQIVFNPCVQGTQPVISDFKSLETYFNEIEVSWMTDIPSTSQVIVTNVKTLEQTVTTSDNILRTEHVLRIQGLPSNSEFRIEAISTSEDLGKSTSPAIIVRTL